MKQEILDLIDIYENEEKYRQRISDITHKEPIPDIAEALNLQCKISFGKDRQRAELLKLNENFLKELSGIKNRLGDKFFKLMEEEIPEASMGDPAHFFNAVNDILVKSDFAKPRVVIVNAFSRSYDEFYDYVYYLPGTPMLGDEYPESEIDEVDTFFSGRPLEWIVVVGSTFPSDAVFGIRHELSFNIEDMEDTKFSRKCKELVFKRYQDKWNEFLAKWHISINWNGDLKYLHLHSLPSVIVDRDNKNHNLPVIIHLGAWATSDDVKRAWPRIEAIMKEARIYRERESEDRLFIRDMIWFRMNTDEASSPSKIAQFWAKKFPEQIDLEVIERVTRDEETFGDVPLKECLEEVLSDDPKMAELRGRFIEARKAFIRIGLKDKVKKSIKKTEEKIKRLGSEDWDRNREKLLKPSH